MSMIELCMLSYVNRGQKTRFKGRKTRFIEGIKLCYVMKTWCYDDSYKLCIVIKTRCYVNVDKLCYVIKTRVYGDVESWVIGVKVTLMYVNDWVMHVKLCL